jgi:hypothetical protein
MLFDTFCKNIKQNHYFFMKMYENTWFWVQNCEIIGKSNENQWESMKIDENR